MPSVFEELILRPDILWKISKSLNSVFAESVSLKIAVVSSAYCRSFVSSFPIAIPFIAELQRAKRASGAPWVRNFGKPSSRENLVLT